MKPKRKYDVTITWEEGYTFEMEAHPECIKYLETYKGKLCDECEEAYSVDPGEDAYFRSDAEEKVKAKLA